MIKYLLTGLIYLCTLCINAQNIGQYFDDGIEDNHGLFISVNSLQLFTGHKAITIEKSISQRFSSTIELGAVNHLVNTYSLGNSISSESLLNDPKNGFYFGLQLSVHAKMFNNYASFGIRFKNYSLNLSDGSKTQMQQYDVLNCVKFLYQHHIFLQLSYGFGFRIAELEKELTPFKTKQIIGLHIPVGLSLGIYL
jgi:hypothetical protein